MGLDPDRIAKINPRLILVQLDAFGGPMRGPKSDHLGYDDLAQAATGVMLRFGGGMKTPEEHAHFGTIDVLGGFYGCVALGAALLRLQNTGTGGVARTSLAAAGNTIQAQFMYDYKDRGPFNEPSGRSVLGWNPYYRCYQTEDDWIFFAAPIDKRNAFSSVPQFEDLSSLDDTLLEKALEARFKTARASHWCSLFDGSNTAVRLSSLQETRDKGLQIDRSEELDITYKTFRVTRYTEHPMGRWIDLVSPNAIRPTTGKVTIPGHMPKYGQHTREILARLGYSNNTISDLISRNIADIGWSEKYIPE